MQTVTNTLPVQNRNEHTATAKEWLKMPSVRVLVLHLAVRVLTTVHETVNTAAALVVSIFM
jgi:hypothetical protein